MRGSSLGSVAIIAGAVVALAFTPSFRPDPERQQVEPALGSFRVECELVQQRRVDPIAAWGEVAPHLHDFFGNTTVVSTSTYETLRAGTSSCSTEGDRTAYWTPTLMSPDGERVEPERGVFYYRNRPVNYRATVAFPPGLRMIAGGDFPNAYWTCDGEKDAAAETRKAAIPDCGTDGRIKAHVFFPSCWDGERLDARDHRSHVAYGVDEDGQVDGTDPKRCPKSHPVKIPQLDLRILYDVADGEGYTFSDDHVLPHADFFNAWDEATLRSLLRQCLGRAGSSCGLVEDS
jgi:hypothetical protein